jgi:hypothetical protein
MLIFIGSSHFGANHSASIGRGFLHLQLLDSPSSLYRDVRRWHLTVPSVGSNVPTVGGQTAAVSQGLLPILLVERSCTSVLGLRRAEVVGWLDSHFLQISVAPLPSHTTKHERLQRPR